VAQKKFIQDVAFVQVLNIAVKAIWILFIDRAVQNSVQGQDYGRYFSLLAFSILFIIFLDLGLNNMNSRKVATDKSFFHKNFFNLLRVKGILSLLYLLLMALIAWMLGYQQDDIFLLLPLGLMQVFISFNAYLRSNLAAFEYFKLDGAFAVMDRALVVVVCGLLLVIPSWNSYLNINAFVYIQLAAVCLVTVFLMRKNHGMRRGLADAFTWNLPKEMMRAALPFALLAALMSIYTRIDAVMLKASLGDAASDAYAMGYRLLDAGNMIAVLLAGILLPMFSSRIEDGPMLQKLSSVSMRLLLIPGLMVVGVSIFYGQEIIDLMYPDKSTLETVAAFKVLISCFIPISLIYIFGTLLTAKKNLKFLNFLAAICVVLNMLLNWVWIPELGIKGASWATFITQSVFALGCVGASFRNFSWSVNAFKFGRLGIFFVSILILSVLAKQFLEGALVPIACVTIMGLVIAWWLRLIDADSVKVLSSRKT
jgi:O-antigen/teichoic acid export membrane protein